MNNNLLINNFDHFPQSQSRRAAADYLGGRLFASRFETMGQMMAGNRLRVGARYDSLIMRRLTARLEIIARAETQRGLRWRMTWDWEGQLQKPRRRKGGAK